MGEKNQICSLKVNYNKHTHTNATTRDNISVQGGFVTYFFHLIHAHVQPLSSFPWHEGWESPAPRPDARGRDNYQYLLQKLKHAEHQWCSVHRSSTQTSVQAACCPLVMAACLAHSPLTLFWSKEDHNCVLLCPGAAALLNLYHVWFGFTAEHWARFPFSLQLGTCQTCAAHLNALPTSIQ